MDPRLHIIVTTENGKTKTFVMSKRILRRIMAIVSVVFVVSTIAGVTYSIENFSLKGKINHLESNVSVLSSEKEGLKHHVVSLEEKAKAQLTGAYGELNQRSQIIDSILSALEITPAPQTTDMESTNLNKGGPFTKISDNSLEELILKVDRDIQTLRPIPLGYPVKFKRISSSFGRRTDPMNGESAFHEGLDLSGLTGARVKATADGKVVERGRNSTYGWYVRIDHGNDFSTMYAHNSKITVSRGTRINRGDIIAHLGSTGRSTGPHLHYEIRYKNKPINPAKFVNINKLVSLASG
ncbi:MAG: M23 family metallopeptidase [Desulfurivibrionaceae bacterium]|nr:M23 family metallopeptidase [Desulfurivibrionaceae bacterium]